MQGGEPLNDKDRFPLVKQYLGLNEKQILSSWTIMTGLIAVCGLVFCLLLWLFS